MKSSFRTPRRTRRVWSTAERRRSCGAANAAAARLNLPAAYRPGAVYLTEADGAPRALTAWLPFTLRLEHPAAKDDTQILMDCRVLAADARLVNSRKILFRAEVGAQIMGFAADRIELPLLKQTPPELQLRCRNYPLPLPSETAEKRFIVSDELTLPAGSAHAGDNPLREHSPGNHRAAHRRQQGRVQGQCGNSDSLSGHGWEHLRSVADLSFLAVLPAGRRL